MTDGWNGSIALSDYAMKRFGTVQGLNFIVWFMHDKASSTRDLTVELVDDAIARFLEARG